MTRLSPAQRSDLELILRHVQEWRSAVCTASMTPIPPEYVGIFQEVAGHIESGVLPDGLKERVELLGNIAWQLRSSPRVHFFNGDSTLERELTEREGRYMDEIVAETFGPAVRGFIGHDIAHIPSGFHEILTICSLIGHSDDFARSFHSVILERDPTYWDEFIANNAEICEAVREVYGSVFGMVGVLCQHRLGQEISVEDVNPFDVITQTAMVSAPRYRARLSRMGLVDAPMGKVLVVEGDTMNAVTNADVLRIVAYNAFKNSGKKFAEFDNGGALYEVVYGKNQQPAQEIKKQYQNYLNSLKSPHVTSAHVRQINDSYMAITFSDSGDPINLDDLLQSIIHKLKHIDDPSSLTWMNPNMKRRFLSWSKNDYAFNLLTTEDITNLAFMAHLSGTHSQTLTSGLGLYGTRILVEALGGAIIYATSFERQNPLFTYILPTVEVPAQSAQDLRRFLIRGRMTA